MLYTVALVIQTALSPDPAFLASLERELDVIYDGSLANFTLHLDSSRLSLGTPNTVIYVNLRGACRPTLAAVRGALASTASHDGVIEPWIEIDCDKLATFVGGHHVPRALARVLAHEVFHFLLQDRDHSHAGLFQTSLTPIGLTSGSAALLPQDLARLQARLSY